MKRTMSKHRFKLLSEKYDAKKEDPDNLGVIPKAIHKNGADVGDGKQLKSLKK